MSTQAEREYDALYDDFERVRTERDALAQRFRDLEIENEKLDGACKWMAKGLNDACDRMDALRAEVEALRELLKKGYSGKGVV